MTTDDLHRIASALYGERWQRRLACELGVTDRTVRRWAAGKEMPQGIAGDLCSLVRRQRLILETIENEIGPA